MTYEETLEYLFSRLPMYQRKGGSAYKPGLDRIATICNLLGNPQDKIKTIHIAGTNGKGSVANATASILQEAGYKVGLYTSPHFKDFRERIKVNGKCIAKEKLVDFVAATKEWDQIQPSFFEYATAMAFQHFADEKVDFAVIETGLGGRLDSTNIIKPLLSIITSIALDHTEFLGSTLPEIAAEKAGIIKANTPVVTFFQSREISEIFERKAFALGSDCITVSKEEIAAHANNGIFKAENLALVTKTMEVLEDLTYAVPKSKIDLGIKNTVHNTGFFGRWFSEDTLPNLFYDVAHNPSGIVYVLSKAEAIAPFTEWNFVFGMVNDKDHSTVLKLLPKKAAYFLCKADVPRALPVKELKNLFDQGGFSSQIFENVALAKKEACTSKRPYTLVFGSFFVVAEALPKNIFKKFD